MHQREKSNTAKPGNVLKFDLLSAFVLGIICAGSSTAAGSGTAAKANDGLPPLDLLAMLCNLPAHGFWRQQQDVERSLALEPGALSSYFQALGRGRKSQAISRKVSNDLSRAGMYRHESCKGGKRVWWMAFVGEGVRKPVFEVKEEDDSIPSEDGRAGVTGPETAVGVTSPKAAVAPATTPETGGSSSA
ncbi:unnamed protein product, partial [Pylaiella littoralis]